MYKSNFYMNIHQLFAENNSSAIRLISCPGSTMGEKWNEMEASDWLRAFFSNVFGHVT